MELKDPIGHKYFNKRMEGIKYERIENKGFAKTVRTFKILTIISLSIVTLLFLTDHVFKITDIGYVNLSGFIFVVGFYYEYKKKSKTLGGQFIEWRENEISFKSRQEEATTIKLDSIDKIEIKSSEVLLNTIEDLSYIINLDDYREYTQKIKIKNNFKLLKTKPNNTYT
tara:strand:+ start:166 stop:672 length:507 start_codon:yes stop_codon:yes gene_type:complete